MHGCSVSLCKWCYRETLVMGKASLTDIWKLICSHQRRSTAFFCCCLFDCSVTQPLPSWYTESSASVDFWCESLPEGWAMGMESAPAKL